MLHWKNSFSYSEWSDQQCIVLCWKENIQYRNAHIHTKLCQQWMPLRQKDSSGKEMAYYVSAHLFISIKAPSLGDVIYNSSFKVSLPATWTTHHYEKIS